MEHYLPISYLNDFVFCPRSIYFHQLYGKISTDFYHNKAQIDGLKAHKTLDSKTYTTAKKVLQTTEIYSEKYNLGGKIDSFDMETGILTERKKKIKQVYDGNRYQLYAQYFCLTEMGYQVKKIRLYSMDDNKVYPIKNPEEEPQWKEKFEQLLEDIRKFTLDATFIANKNKCKNCIYNNLCDMSLC